MMFQPFGFGRVGDYLEAGMVCWLHEGYGTKPLTKEDAIRHWLDSCVLLSVMT